MKFDVFISKIDDISFVEKHSERINKLLKVELDNLLHIPYVTLKREIPKLIDEGKYEEVILTVLKSKKKSITLRRVKRANNYDKIKFLFWVQDQYGLIKTLEETHLRTPPDGKLLAAGISELDQLGDINLIDSLAQGDILKWEAVGKLPYEMVFNKQFKTVIETRVTKKLNKMK